MPNLNRHSPLLPVSPEPFEAARMLNSGCRQDDTGKDALRTYSTRPAKYRRLRQPA